MLGLGISKGFDLSKILNDDTFADFIKEEAKAVSNEAFKILEEETGIPVERIIQLVKAEQEGRLVIVPDKLFYVLFDDVAPEKSYITEYPTNGACIMFAGDYIPVSEIGKTVFLTKEEAEAALKNGTSHS